MAVEYMFHISTKLAPIEVLSNFVGEKEIKDLPGNPSIKYFKHNNLVAYAYNTSPERRSFLLEILNISPTISILFRIEARETQDNPMDAMVNFVNNWLKRTSGDLIFTFQNDFALLTRKDGHVVVNRNYGLQLKIDYPHSIDNLPDF